MNKKYYHKPEIYMDSALETIAPLATSLAVGTQEQTVTETQAGVNEAGWSKAGNLWDDTDD